MNARPANDLDQPLRLVRRADGRLCAVRDGKTIPVRPVRCFPWSQPDGHVSLRDDDDEEVALIVDPAELDEADRAALAEDLAAASFVLAIERITAVRDELEIRVWKVETRQGTRTFLTARDEWPRPLPGGGLLLRDVAGDLYLVADPTRLDETSRRLLWAFVD